jgi:hypothetical protein
MNKSSKRSTGWKGLGTRVEVLDLNKLTGESVGELSRGINALKLNKQED